MSKIAVVQFTSGEVTEDIDARKDIEQYIGGCRTLQNMIPDIYGNASKRPGTEMIVVGNGSGCYFETPPEPPNSTPISTPQELQDINDDLVADYHLINDIDMTGFDFIPIGKNQTTGADAAGFLGTLDGRYFIISNLTIDVTGEALAFHTNNGLFNRIYTSGVNIGTVQRIILTDVVIKNERVHATFGRLATAGLLAGQISSGASISDIFTSGSMLSYSLMQNTGGIVGQVTIGTDLTRCGTVITLTATNGNMTDIGGLFGDVGSGSTITDCYAQGTINLQDATKEANDIGGLIGEQTGTPQVTNCYSAVTFTIADTTPTNLGGFVGNGASSTFTDCYWDGTLAPTLDDIGDLGDTAGITKSNTTAMFKQDTYENWDFDDVWEIEQDVDYPKHRWDHLARVCKRL